MKIKVSFQLISPVSLNNKMMNLGLLYKTTKRIYSSNIKTSTKIINHLFKARINLIKDLHFPKVESLTHFKKSSANLVNTAIPKLLIIITLMAHNNQKIKVKKKINKRFNSRKGDSKN